MSEPVIIRTTFIAHCTGPNNDCKKAHSRGRSFHLIPGNYRDENGVWHYATMDTYHFIDIQEAMQADVYYMAGDKADDNS